MSADHQQFADFLFGQSGQGFISGLDNGIDQILLALLELVHLILNGAPSLETDDLHNIPPSHSVSAVGRLLFHGGIPPQVYRMTVSAPSRADNRSPFPLRYNFRTHHQQHDENGNSRSKAKAVSNWMRQFV